MRNYDYDDAIKVDNANADGIDYFAAICKKCEAVYYCSTREVQVKKYCERFKCTDGCDLFSTDIKIFFEQEDSNQ